MKNIGFCLVFFVFFSCKSGSDLKENPKRDMDFEKKTIKIENVSFDENDLMKIVCDEGNIVAYFDRVENKNYSVKSIKVYDIDKNEKKILVPIVDLMAREVIIHIKDLEENKLGEIIYLMKSGISVDYFGKPYHYKIKLSSANYKASIYYQNLLVLYHDINFTSKRGYQSKITVNKDYLELNQHDISVFVLIDQLYLEILKEEAKNNPTPAPTIIYR